VLLTRRPWGVFPRKISLADQMSYHDGVIHVVMGPRITIAISPTRGGRTQSMIQESGSRPHILAVHILKLLTTPG